MTLAFALTRHFPHREALAYIAAQLLGAIGGTVGLDALFGGPITGASMNPARSIGPALVSGELHDLWIYIAAPIAGAAAGALAYQLVRSTPQPPADVPTWW